VEFTMLELARTVLELTGSESRVVHVALPEDDPKVRRPDISRARALLGFNPRVDLRQGLRRTIVALERALARGKPWPVRALDPRVRRAGDAARAAAPLLAAKLGSSS